MTTFVVRPVRNSVLVCLRQSCNGTFCMAETRTRQFDALVAPHLPVLYRVAWRLLRNSPDAHDLVQDTCIAACENLSDLQAAEHPDRWLLQVLRNRFINVARRRRRAPFVALDDFPEVAQFS